MVTIKYYKDPLTGECIESNHPRVIDFVRGNFFTRDEILDLRYFDGEVLGVELHHILELDHGVIAITHDSAMPRTPDMWVYAAIALVTAVATVLLMPSVSAPAPATSQQSATNKLGESQNEPRVGQRIDDLFGYVAKHMPPLWQYPYRVGINNQEAEILLLCLGRGRYQTNEDRWYDGETRIIDIPNAQLSKYEPGTWPGNGSPSFQIGSPISEKIGVYRQSNDLNPAELLPPNDLDNSLGATWKITGTTMTVVDRPDGFELMNSFQVDSVVYLKDFYYMGPDTPASVTLYSVTIPAGQAFAAKADPVDLGGGGMLEYVVTAVTEDTVTLAIPPDAPPEVSAAWAAMSNYAVPELYWHLTGVTPTVDFYTPLTPVTSGPWFTDVARTHPVTVTAFDPTPLSGEVIDGYIGPFRVHDDADELILNFVSASGFYKLDQNKEQKISANIEILIEELDTTGNVTGNSTVFPVVYESNNSTRKSVFQTKRLVLPYNQSQVSAVRTTDRDKSDNIANVDIIEWRDLYSFENNPPVDFGDVTLAHVVIPSNSQSRLIKERKQNVDVTRMVTQYMGNGVFGPPESYATDNFAQVLIHMSLDPFVGRLTLDNINADGWLLLSPQIEEYYESSQMVRFGYDFDDTQVTYQDCFIQLANVIGCRPYTQNGVYDLSFERRQDVSSMQITCRNKMPDSEVREDIFERQYNGVEVTWRDSENGVSETFYVPEDRSATNPERVELLGCITREQAYKFAYRSFNKQIYNRQSITFEVDEFGRNIIPGRRIDSPDGTRFVARDGVEDGYRIYDGEVVEVSGLVVELSEPVAFTAGEDHYITFTTATGYNSDPILCTRVDDFRVALSSLPVEPIYDGYQMDRTKYVMVSEQLRESMALLPQTIEFKLDDAGNETNTVTSINYDARYYRNDQDVV